MKINPDNTITLDSEECEKLMSMVSQIKDADYNDKLKCLFEFLEENAVPDEIDLNISSCLRCEDKRYRKFIRKFNVEIFKAFRESILESESKEEKIKYHKRMISESFFFLLVSSAICAVFCRLYTPENYLLKIAIIMLAVLAVAHYLGIVRRAFIINGIQKEE